MTGNRPTLVLATAAPSPGYNSDLIQSLAARASPGRDIRSGLIIAAVFFLGFIGWSAVARLDAAAIAAGKLVVSGQRQTVQHRDGGVVAGILVREGQHVEKGQVLVRLAAAEVEAQEKALASQAISLLAQRARLQAEQAGQARIAAPPEFATLQGPNRQEADRAMELQYNQMRTRMAVLSAQRGVLGQRTSQASSSGQGFSRQLAATDKQIQLIEAELDGLQVVAEKGFVSRNRIRALERTKADLEGQRGQFAATVAQSGSQAGESRLQILEAQNNYYERIASDLREVETALADIRPKWDAARDQLARTEIRAPATGAVVGLTIFTPGGVIAAGQKLMDIVPDRAELKVEARVSPTNADDVRRGQRALVRFDTLHEKALPALKGVVTRFSADTISDEHTGEPYYSAEITIPAEELRQIDELRGAHTLRAGIPVTIEIPTRKRTALEYAFEPLNGAVRRSLHEQ
jgi:HlyD family secretion protein